MPSKSKSQARLMAACAHGAGYDSCPPLKVAKEFNRADKGRNLKKLPVRMAGGGGLKILKADPLRTFSSLYKKFKGQGALSNAERLGRLFEESPEAFHVLSPEALDSAVSYTGNRPDAKSLTMMRPQSFLDLAAPLTNLDEYDRAKIRALRAMINREQPSREDLDQLDPHNFWRKEMGSYDGWHEPPFLQMSPPLSRSSRLPQVRGHEGRHRFRALQEDFPDVRIPTVLNSGGNRPFYDILEGTPPPRVRAEREYGKKTSPIRPLPIERYAGGGSVPKSIMRVIQRAAQKYPQGSTEELLTRPYDRHALVSARPQPTPAKYPSDREIWNTRNMNPRNVYSLDADQRSFIDAALSDIMEMGTHPSWVQGPKGYIATRPQAGFGHASYFPDPLGMPGLVGVDENILNTAMALSRKDPRAAQTVRGFLGHELGHSMDRVQSPFQLTGNKGPLEYEGLFFDPRIEFADGAAPTRRWYEPKGSVVKEIDSARYLQDGNPRPRMGLMAEMLGYPLASWPPQYHPPFLTSSTAPDLGPSEIFAQLLRLDQNNLTALTPKAREFVQGLRKLPVSQARNVLADRMKGYKAGGAVKGGIDAVIAWLNRQFSHPPSSVRTPAIMQEVATTTPPYGLQDKGMTQGASWLQQMDESVPVLEAARRHLSPESKRLLGEPRPVGEGVWMGSRGMEHNPVFPLPLTGRIPSVRKSAARPLAELGEILGQDAEAALRFHPSVFREPNSRSNAALIPMLSRDNMEQLSQFWGNRGLGTIADRSGQTIAFPFSGDPRDADKMFADLESMGITFRPGISNTGTDRTFGARSGDYADFLYGDVLDASDIDRVTAGRTAVETARLGAGRPLPKRRKPR